MSAKAVKARPSKAKATAQPPAPQASEPAADARAERIWTAGVAAIAAVILATSFSSNIQFGDSAESVSGVESLGILHAPGYPAYVLAAKAFTVLIPFGDAAFQVNLFSLAASVASVAIAFRCGRLLGADRPGAAVGALSLAVGLSFWYYATYAKAYALTTLLLLGVFCVLLSWKEHGGWQRLVAAGALIGFASGAAYQVALLATPGLAVLLFAAGRRPTAKQLAAALGTGLAVVVAVMGYVLVRAGQDPALSWGGASTPSRLIDLIRMRDFGFGSKGSGSARLTVGGSSAGSTGGGAGGGGSRGGGTGLGGLIRPRVALRLPLRVLNFPLWVARDLGPLLSPLAAVGVVSSWRRKSPGRLALTVIAVSNICGAGLFLVGNRPVRFLVPSSSLVVSLGGFMLAATAMVSLWVGLGASAVLAWARRDTTRQLSNAERRRRERSGRTTERLPAQFVVALLAVALLATAVLHRTDTSHRAPPYARDYASNVFASLPKNSLLLTWVAERSFALEEQQIVDGRRTDIDVVRLEQLGQPWYREQLNKRLGTELPLRPKGNQLEEGGALATQLLGTRPVFLDHAGLYYVSRAVPDLGFRQRGLVAEVVEGKGKQPPDLAAMDRLLGKGGELTLRGFDDPAADRWPNSDMLLAYAYALIDYGSALGKDGRFADAVDPLELALVIDPRNTEARVNLQAVQQQLRAGG